MKKIQVTFDGTTDTTGYLFSLAKCLSASLRCSEYRDFADDIVAASGFAFRMWVDSDQLCPSSTSIWDFGKQKVWVENGGLVCDYVQRLWGEDAIEEKRRLAAIRMIEDAIDRGTAPVVWDISGCEWGLIVGYDRGEKCLYTLKISGEEDQISYERLGKLEIPILSVLAVTGKAKKSDSQLVADTKRLAHSHLCGEEWCENAKGLAAYDALIAFIQDKLTSASAWNLEYCLGTFGALKWYAWKFFENHQENDLARSYEAIYTAWIKAFDLVRTSDATEVSTNEKLIELLEGAKLSEYQAAAMMAQ